MIRIDCLVCGVRDHTEFRYGGDASKPRPAHGTSDARTLGRAGVEAELMLGGNGIGGSSCGRARRRRRGRDLGGLAIGLAGRVVGCFR